MTTWVWATSEESAIELAYKLNGYASFKEAMDKDPNPYGEIDYLLYRIEVKVETA